VFAGVHMSCGVFAPSLPCCFCAVLSQGLKASKCLTVICVFSRSPRTRVLRGQTLLSGCSHHTCITSCMIYCSSSHADGSSTTRASSGGFSRGGAARRCETWIVLELCSLGSLQVRHAPKQQKSN